MHRGSTADLKNVNHRLSPSLGARCSSVVERPFMGRWVVGSIPHGVPIELFLVPTSFHDWLTKDRRMCYPFCGYWKE